MKKWIYVPHDDSVTAIIGIVSGTVISSYLTVCDRIKISNKNNSLSEDNPFISYTNKHQLCLNVTSDNRQVILNLLAILIYETFRYFYILTNGELRFTHKLHVATIRESLDKIDSYNIIPENLDDIIEFIRDSVKESDLTKEERSAISFKTDDKDDLIIVLDSEQDIDILAEIIILYMSDRFEFIRDYIKVIHDPIEYRNLEDIPPINSDVFKIDENAQINLDGRLDPDEQQNNSSGDDNSKNTNYFLIILLFIIIVVIVVLVFNYNKISSSATNTNYVT